MQNRSVIFVLGAPRSGTSALARTLSLCGGTLPDRVLAPRDLNPTGFWEPVEAVRINHEFLFQNYDAALNQLASLDSEIRCAPHERSKYINKIREFLAQCPKKPLLIIKENDIPVFLSFWSEAAHLQNLDVAAILCIRPPQEVIQSWIAWGASTQIDLNEVDPKRRAFFEILWLGRNLIMERASRGMRRVVVAYPRLLEDGVKEMTRVGRSLSLTLKIDEDSICKFIRTDLHTRRSSGADRDEALSAWTSRLFMLMSQAAQDCPMDFTALNALFDEYRSNPEIPSLINSFRGPIDIPKAMGQIDTWPVWHAGRDYS